MQLGRPAGRDRDAVLARSLQSWGDADLLLTISIAATILGARWRMDEGAVMARLTELAKLQDAAAREAQSRAMLQ